MRNKRKKIQERVSFGVSPIEVNEHWATTQCKFLHNIHSLSTTTSHWIKLPFRLVQVHKHVIVSLMKGF